jgi:DNA-binding response OmpR family regulator
VVRALQETDGYDIRTANNGFEAGVVAQQFRPHIIVLDVDNGVAEANIICQNIRVHADLQSVKLLGSSANMDESTRQSLFTQGFDGTLTKPYSLRQLLQAIEELTSLVR